MTDYDFLIKEKIEDTDFDLKKVPYKPETKFDFIKDVMAMANADIHSDRYIVIGVSLDKETGRRDVIGIEETEIRDSSDYQSWVQDYIEPKIDLNYFPHKYDGKMFGIIKISNCVESPYMIKKELNDQKTKKRVLQVGEAWIRKNSRQDRMNRTDLEHIYQKRLEKRGFSGDVRVLFSGIDSDTYPLSVIDEMILPSKRDYEKITKFIERKTQNQKTSSLVNKIFVNLTNFLGQYFSLDRRYFKMDLDELIDHRNKILENFSERDYSIIFGIMANRVNITIENLGEEYIEDASIKIIFPTEGLAISDHEPHYNYKMPTFNLANPWDYYRKQLYNHNVNYGYREFEVTKELGDIKHGMLKEIFSEPLRISVNKSFIGKTITINCYIYGKNLKKPIFRELILKAISY